MSKPTIDTVLDLSIEVAKFYGGLRAGGVPEIRAAVIAGEYLKNTLQLRMLKDAGMLPKNREPWDDS